MKIKKPSLKGMKNCEYLGHFGKEKYLSQGHNFSGKMELSKGEMGMSKDQPDYVVEITKPMEIGISPEKRAQIDAQLRRKEKNKRAIDRIKALAAGDEMTKDYVESEMKRREAVRSRIKKSRDY